MTKRILLAWELGGGRGHVYILGWIAEALRTRGYEPIFAVQRTDVLGAVAWAAAQGVCFQAPIWPGLLDRTLFRTPEPQTMGDLLAGVGMSSPEALGSMIRAWDHLIAVARPAAIVANYAPACILAARGRVPVVAVGDGFTVPPATLTSFPAFESGTRTPKHDEQALTSTVNDCLRGLGRPPIEHLPQVFGADRSCAASFIEFDPYAGYRTGPATAPWVPRFRNVHREENELYVYLSMNTPLQVTVLAALRDAAANGMPVRIHAPSTTEAALAPVIAAGAILEPAPLPFEEIQRRSRLVFSYGSYGFLSTALAAGIPQIVVPLGIARSVTGKTIDRLEVGRWLPVNPDNPLEIALIAQAIAECHADDRMAANAARLAPDFNRRLEPRPAAVVADLVEELV